jgi:triphosphatase
VDGVEIELKLSVIRPDVGRALVDAPEPDMLAGFAADGAVHEQVITDRYLDTALDAGALRAAATRARLRSNGTAVVLAVKGRGSVAPDGVTTRTEVEGPATATIDPASWPPSAARDLLLERAGGLPLHEIAALRQRRLVRLLRRGETIVELSLDEIAALAGETVLATRIELEAELKAGPPSALGDLAAALASIDGLAPAVGSKLEFALGARRSAEAGR